jgi:hypothetical protein
MIPSQIVERSHGIGELQEEYSRIKSDLDKQRAEQHARSTAERDP